jgi:hypothetical protein
MSARRTRAEAIVTGEHGADATHTVPAGFRIARTKLEQLEASALERSVQIHFGPYRPLAGYNNPLDGRDLSECDLTIRVGYLVTPEIGEGSPYEALGGDSGPSDDLSVEDRQEADAKILRDCIGWQGNWSGLTPHVIDVEPSADGDAEPIDAGDRVIREIRFVYRTRGSLPDATLYPRS